jgi:hypothetical protein
MATPGYLATLGIHLITRRDFSNESTTSPHAAIVNQLFADTYFPNENPSGQSVSGRGVTYEIIGVTNNIKARFLGEALRPVLFRPLAQTVANDPSLEGYTILARPAADSASAKSAFVWLSAHKSPASNASLSDLVFNSPPLRSPPVSPPPSSSPSS